MMQLRMGLGWVFLIREEADWIVLAYRLDHIISAGSYRIGCIVSGNTGFYALAGLLLAGWDRWTGWDIGGTGVGWRD